MVCKICKSCKICSGLGTLERQNNTAREEEETEVENIVFKILYSKYCLKDIKYCIRNIVLELLSQGH